MLLDLKTNSGKATSEQTTRDPNSCPVAVEEPGFGLPWFGSTSYWIEAQTVILNKCSKGSYVSVRPSCIYLIVHKTKCFCTMVLINTWVYFDPNSLIKHLMYCVSWVYNIKPLVTLYLPTPGNSKCVCRLLLPLRWGTLPYIPGFS